MVVIERGRDIEQSLQQAMNTRRLEKVIAAHDVGDALQRIVDDDG